MDAQRVAGVVRPATVGDVPRMVALAEAKRVEQMRQQPVFWRQAADAADRHAAYLTNQLTREGVFALLHEWGGAANGFLIGVTMQAPPVYDPGGPGCLNDDFAVSDPVHWGTAGVALLDEALRQARARGAVTVQVICGHYDAPKRAVLAAAGFPVVSEWWVKEL